MYCWLKPDTSASCSCVIPFFSLNRLTFRPTSLRISMRRDHRITYHRFINYSMYATKRRRQPIGRESYGAKMARFLPQDGFDTMAITYLMVGGDKSMSEEWESLVQHFADGPYRGENYSSLRRQLIEASAVIEQLFDPELRRSPQDYFSVLKALSSSIRSDAKKRRPFIKRLFGGTLFIHEKKAPTDRIVRCRQDVAQALAKLALAAFKHESRLAT
jgi:hypothetical protein